MIRTCFYVVTLCAYHTRPNVRGSKPSDYLYFGIIPQAVLQGHVHEIGRNHDCKVSLLFPLVWDGQKVVKGQGMRDGNRIPTPGAITS